MTKKRLRIIAVGVVVATAFALQGLGSTIDFEPSTYNPMPGESVRFAVCEACLGESSYLFEWDLDGDGRFEKTSSDTMVSVNFAAAGYVEVTLRAAGDRGHRSLCTKALIIGDVPFLARRELLVESGSLFVVVTIQVYQTVRGLGLLEEIPAGWQIEIVDPGGAIVNRSGNTQQALWASETVPGELLTFSYRLYRSSGWEEARFGGTVSGFLTSQSYAAVPVCGEISEPQL